MSNVLSTGGRWLKRGDTFDPEDHRMTHRLMVARGILRNLGIEPTVAHSEMCADRKKAAYGYNGCDDRCQTTWTPDWVTDGIFDAAYKLADAFQTERGAFNRGERRVAS